MPRKRQPDDRAQHQILAQVGTGVVVRLPEGLGLNLQPHQGLKDLS